MAGQSLFKTFLLSPTLREILRSLKAQEDCHKTSSLNPNEAPEKKPSMVPKTYGRVQVFFLPAPLKI